MGSILGELVLRWSLYLFETYRLFSIQLMALVRM